MSSKDYGELEDLLRLILYAALSARRRGKQMLSSMDYDLTFEQVFVLRILSQEEGLQLSALAEKADRERTTMSRMIDGLEKRKLVVRIADKYDKRQRLVHLTKLGRDRLAQIHSSVVDLSTILYRGIGKSHLEITYNTLRAIIANAEER